MRILFLCLIFVSCASYDRFRQFTEEYEVPAQVFKADFGQTWKALLEIMKKYDIAQQNQQNGTIKTHWIDNTQEINFKGKFNSNSIKAAKFKLALSAVKGVRSGREVTKVTVYKRQLVEQDFLQGWKEVKENSDLENSILYRIQRLITIDNKLRAIDKAKQDKLLKSF